MATVQNTQAERLQETGLPLTVSVPCRRLYGARNVANHFVDKSTPMRGGSPEEIRAITVDGPKSFNTAATKKLVREPFFTGVWL